MVYQASYFLDTRFIKPIETCFQGLFHLYLSARWFAFANVPFYPVLGAIKHNNLLGLM